MIRIRRPASSQRMELLALANLQNSTRTRGTVVRGLPFREDAREHFFRRFKEERALRLHVPKLHVPRIHRADATEAAV